MLLLFLLLWGGMASISVLAQDKSITGKVTADDGSGLSGVSVVIKGIPAVQTLMGKVILRLMLLLILVYCLAMLDLLLRKL